LSVRRAQGREVNLFGGQRLLEIFPFEILEPLLAVGAARSDVPLQRVGSGENLMLRGVDLFGGDRREFFLRGGDLGRDIVLRNALRSSANREGNCEGICEGIQRET